MRWTMIIQNSSNHYSTLRISSVIDELTLSASDIDDSPESLKPSHMEWGNTKHHPKEHSERKDKPLNLIVCGSTTSVALPLDFQLLSPDSSSFIPLLAINSSPPFRSSSHPIPWIITNQQSYHPITFPLSAAFFKTDKPPSLSHSVKRRFWFIDGRGPCVHLLWLKSQNEKGKEGNT